MVRVANILLVTILLLGCDSEQVATSFTEGEEGTITITTRAEGSTEDATDNFADGSTIRIAVYESDSENRYSTLYLSEDFGDMYSDIYGTRTSGVWKYSFDGGSSSSVYFGYIKEENASIDMVAAYPYVSNEDLSAVSFDIASQGSTSNLGYMWATDNDISLNTSSLGAELYFQHIMTALNLRMVLKNNATYTTLYSVTLTLTDKDDNAKSSIISKGTIDFTTGAITDPTPVSSQTITINTDCASTTINGETRYYIEKPLYLPPFTMESTDKLTLSFSIDGVTIPETITLTGDQFTNDIDTTYGMARGTRYSLDIELDNYLKFSGTITKETEWDYTSETQTSI